MLDRANSGLEPCAEILRAIRHGVAAGACSVAARETGGAYWAALAADQREKAKVMLHQASTWSACALARSSNVTAIPAREA